MSKNYYEILNISPKADLKEIANAYRNLSLKWHPKLKKTDINTTYHKFCDIAEAYEVLNDPKKREIFDKYGENSWKEGIFLYKFNGNPEEIFEKFFGTNNPYPQILEGETKKEYGTLISNAFGRKTLDSSKKLEDLVVNVECTLSELYNGCMKKVTYNRQKLNPDERTTRIIQETKDIEIKKGFLSENNITFKDEGHEANGVPNSDLIFKIKELPHPNYKRRQNDLIYYVNIDLVDALSAKPINIITLDNRKLLVPYSSIINPKTVTVIKGEGMPIYNKDEYRVEFFNKPLEKGDLSIHFDIKFPKQLSAESKQELKKYLH